MSWRARVKTLIPKSLFGRTLMIVVAPLVLLQAVAAGLFVQRHIDGVSRQMAGVFAEELTYFVARAEAGDSSAFADPNPLGYPMRLIAGAAPPGPQPVDRPLFYELTERALHDALAGAIKRPFFIEHNDKELRITVSLETRGALVAEPPKTRLSARNPHLLFVWTGAVAIVLCVIAVLFLRNQIKPIHHLAQTADAIGRGADAPAIVARGAAEVRQAAVAFQRMRRRIDRHIEQRTLMLSAVSHDLRTPLTRLTLGLEMADPGPDRDALLEDAAQMRALIDEYLCFARGDNLEEPEEIDLADLVASVVEDTRRGGGQATLTRPPGPVMACVRAGALRRALQNLIDNALRYGTTVRVAVAAHPQRAEIFIDDDGPGIPPGRHNDALQAFVRLDDARGRNFGAGGVGLGLTIARDAARQHGGDLKLQQSPLGGLRALVILPLEEA